ncbi:TetR/AcrR family transcriptional regulator [bacterium (Candidatus Blackallbacteria) CG17_big_fil_post_rev_8_21_14_2_50_48_46]|uniref:TetR/AcrR family transcriptional regulator n=1 Tax=bacterium (Candidatus Blackallbacteria) CG17_big_fil_post_rev_8_21_14_2_50_48_46 TaxID=2014261 RepID=A0A2M7G4G8_9BACT|nr:MAG: TetR family transcriptional regulator [bacterium (Candidatus Blackallbacteria) CG18_big_fil_WC_8_21_14_2_50_49_26]PIW16641.1 MAG: TetR/AcrR family transcriptional regulator [bacterium (Candidatus Blackallbacteria) CG17_big_fil_post_rev_8_21_14_2_50_48_46]PIW46148.1 MAG: TetR/AcrR family transcriptional regulator [bacterium (Candidatus Blackallbacteria) CG13_big_fil_rev_8_21_14_2_50_49_14]
MSNTEMPFDNRLKLIQVGLALFARRGYSSVGVQEIVKAAGVTKPTLYHYFGHKQGLLEAILAAYSPAFLSCLQKAADYQGDLILCLEGLVKGYLDLVQAEPDFFYLQLSMSYLPAEHETEPLIQPFRQALQALLEQLFIQAVPQHGNLKGHHALLASSLTGLLNHSALGLLKGGLENRSDLVHRVVKQYMYGIYVL